MNRLSLGLLLVIVSFINSHAQGPVKTGLHINPGAKARLDMSAIASGIADTLHLPFFDDFAYDGPNPLDSMWVDDDVFINNTFTKDQITRGVATFDHLDANGTPYDFLSRFASSHSDSLTSQCINLKRDKSNNTYALSDSIFLSFYIQTGGLGDTPEDGDSLILQFKDQNGSWNRVWNITGNSASLFTQYFVGIKNVNYLFDAFQFRFINYVKNSGNMNHFHLDYVELNADRKANEISRRAIAFTKQPTSLLSPYSVMPYDHFKTNPTAYMSSSSNREFYMRNNDQSSSTAAFVSYQFEAKNEQGTILGQFAGFNAENIPKQSSITKTIESFPMSSLVGDTPTVTTRYYFDPSATFLYDSLEQGDYDNTTNNSITTVTRFHHYYAYDDGSAEVGYALDYSGLPNGPGYTVVGFDLPVADTLQGVDIHFNRAFEEVGNRPIKIQFWADIANGPGKADSLIYELDAVPSYINGRNGFARFELDTLIVLPPGKFFVGWQQNSDFKINVGWDENYNKLNPNIYYNLIGTWSPLPNGFNGTLMIRPLIGEPIPRQVSVKEVRTSLDFNLFPNPSKGKFNLHSDSRISYRIYDLSGKLITASNEARNKHLVQLLEKGIYICLVTSEDHLSTTTKKVIIK